jgi:PAS domain S-box-containing protein
VVRKKVAVFVDLYRHHEQVAHQAELLRAAERREYELRLAELRCATDRRYRKLVEGIDNAIAWTMNDERRLTFVSAQAPRILGYPLAEFIEPDFFDKHVHPDDQEPFRTLCERGLEADPDDDLCLNHRVIAAGGRVLWFHTGISGDDQQGGELHGISVDITDVKETEAFLRQATRAREHLLTIVSHDLRTPLTAVVANAGLIEQRAANLRDGARLQKSAQVIMRSGQRMDRLISDLMEFAQLECGRLKVECRYVPANEVVVEVVETLLPLAQERGVRLRARSCEDLFVQCDRGRVLQILSNLVGNAIKFTPKGGSVRVGVKLEEQEARFFVADSGPGIPAEELPQIWERFWRSRKATAEGVGLGLAIAKGLVEAQNGRIWVDTRIGEGTTFHFTMPLAAPPN